MIETPVKSPARAAVVLQGRAVANLTFHGIGEPGRVVDPGEANVRVSAQVLHEILDVVASRDRPNGPQVNITIDDGNRSDLSLVAPLLAARGLVGTFFICAGRLSVKGYMDAFEVRQLVAMGMRIGSHGMDHVSWRGLSKDRLAIEVYDAKSKLEDILGAPIREAACPFGEYDRKALRILAENGFERVFTSDRVGAREGQWLQARWSVRSDDTPGSISGYVRSASRLPWIRTLLMTAKRWR